MRPSLGTSARSLSAVAAAALLAATAGCGQGARSSPAPLDRFTYPTGLTLVPVEGSARPALAVVSSNYDLRYSPDLGGSVLVVDPDASSGADLRILGAAQIGSFGGELALLSGSGTTDVPASCAGWTGSRQLLVPSRNQEALYRLEVGAAGTVACGTGCKIGLDPALADPYGVQVACRATATGLEASAYVSHLRAPQNRGWLSKVGLQDGSVSLIDLGSAPPHTFAWDAARARLYVTGRFGVIDLAPLRWLEPAFEAPGLVPVVHVQNFGLQVRGAELRSMALSSDGTRGYLAVRIFDRDLVTSVGVRANDLAGALAVVDLTETPTGPSARLLRLVPVGIGPNQVAVVPRAGRRDLVAVSNTDEGTVSLYDDDAGAVVAILGGPGSAPLPGTPDDVKADGKPVFGAQPFGLAVGPAETAGKRRLYVGAFDRGMIVAVDVDLESPSNVTFVRRFGREMPPP